MAEELTSEQEQELVAALRALQGELEQLLGHLATGAETVDLDQPIGRLSRMDAIQQQQMSAANKRTTELRLKLVGQALQAADAGDYGVCRKCDEPIGYRRLAARPEAALCVACQGASERR
jgi:DnaK suppressor protein